MGATESIGLQNFTTKDTKVHKGKNYGNAICVAKFVVDVQRKHRLSLVTLSALCGEKSTAVHTPIYPVHCPDAATEPLCFGRGKCSVTINTYHLCL